MPETKVNFKKIFNISAKSNQNVEELCFELRNVIDIIDDGKRTSNSSDQKYKNSLMNELV